MFHYNALLGLMGKYPKNGQGKLALSAILLGLLDRSAAILTRIGFYSRLVRFRGESFFGGYFASAMAMAGVGIHRRRGI